MQDYSWPGMFKPFDHQKTTAEFLVDNPRAFCFNEAGTGKTSSVIWACDYLMNQGILKRVLIICPLSIMYSAWQSDLFKTAMHRRTAVAYGSASKRSKIINSNYEFVIINYDGVNIVAKDIYNAGFDLIVVDEANAYKTSTTLRWKTLKALVLPYTGLWMLTGTPASQSPVDAYGLAKLVCPENVPKFFGAWRDRVMFPVTKFKWSPRPGARDVVYKVLQPAIRFTKDECLDLPEVMYQYRSAPMTGQQQKYYLSLKNEMLIKAAGEKVSAVNAAAMLTKLLQISGGAVYSDSGEVLEFDVSHRLRVLEEVMVETERKVIVFVPYTHTIELVHKHLIKGGYTAEIVNGQVSAGERAAIFSRFQTTDHPRVLVVQPQAASHGITLTAADTIVFWSPVMSVETYIQCVARIDRVGQQHKMTVIHLEGSEVERKMYRMLENKIDLHEKLVELYSSEMEAENESE
jgi:SNF2 family DNA or RNA helicase